MNKNEIIILKNTITLLSKKQNTVLPFNKDNIKKIKIDRFIVNKFIKENFKNIDNKNFKYIRINCNNNANPSFRKSNNEVELNLYNSTNLIDTLKNINVFADLSQDLIKQSTDSIKGGVIPLVYEEKFVNENSDLLGNNSNFWFYYNLYLEAKNLAKKSNSNKDIKRLYAILLIIQNKFENTTISEDIISSTENIEKLLDKKEYTLKQSLLTYIN